MDGELFRVSHTKVQSFGRCHKQYWFRYVSALPRPADPQVPAMIVGKGVHRAMKALCDTGREEDGAAELDVYLRMPIHECAGPGTEWHRLAFELYARGCLAHREIDSEARWAELETWVPSPKRAIAVSSRADRVDRLRGGTWQLVDWKTGRWDMDETVDAQLDIAHLALRTIRRLAADEPVQAVAWNLRTGERRQRALVRYDAAATMDRLAAIASRMRAMTEFEATPGPVCSACEWRPQCPDSADAVAAAAEF